jgi:DNA repair protein RadC
MRKPKPSKIVDKTLFVREAGGEYRIAPLTLVIDRARTLLDEQIRTVEITSPDKARDWCMVRLAPLDHEVFGCLLLDNAHRVIEWIELFRGTLTQAAVFPREVIKAVLEHNAAAVMFSHNHPSGMAEPSEADKLITGRLKKVLAMIDVRVIDHIIVAGGQSYSFAKHGLI